MKTETVYEKTKLFVESKISKELLNDIKIQTFSDDSDILTNMLTARMTAYVYSNLSEERNLTYYFDKPTFFEWLFRKKRKAVFNLKVKDLLLNAPKSENTMRIYVVDKSEQN